MQGAAAPLGMYKELPISAPAALPPLNVTPSPITEISSTMELMPVSTQFGSASQSCTASNTMEMINPMISSKRITQPLIRFRRKAIKFVFLIKMNVSAILRVSNYKQARLGKPKNFEIAACCEESKDHIGMNDCSWPEARVHHGSPKLSITDRSKPASDCFRWLNRNGGLGQKQPLAFDLQVSPTTEIKIFRCV